MSDRPDLITCHIADVTECAPVVSRAVFTPTGDRNVLPAAVAASGVRDHHVVTAVRQQLNFRGRRVRSVEDAQRRFSSRGTGRCVGDFSVMWVSAGGLRNTLLQQ